MHIMNGAEEPTVRIGEAVVGAGQPVYVVAEAGVNHNGDLSAACALVEAAKAAGADAVKFQAFRADALVTATADAATYQQQGAKAQTQRELLARVELSPAQFKTIARHCRNLEIEFLATPFGEPELEMLVGLGVRAIKIASPDVTNVPLLRRAASTGLPLIASTGASDLDEIDALVATIDEAGAHDRLILLHCVSSYPAADSEANLRTIQTLAKRHGRPTGFSDHTESVGIGGLAAAAGAVLLEKHFTLDRRQDGPDHAFSLEPAQLREYVRSVRHAEVVLGRGVLCVLQSEWEVRRLTRSSVVSVAAITKGETISAAKIAIKRPGTGIPPGEFDRVVGRVAAVDIPADTPMQWEMLQ